MLPHRPWRQSPEALVESNETRRFLEKALALLDEKHRLVFLQSDMEGMSVKETAHALGRGESKVKALQLRARLQPHEHLTRTPGDPRTRIERGHSPHD